MLHLIFLITSAYRMIIGRCNQHTRRNHAYEYPHRAVIRPSCWVLSIILERAMHRIRMRTRTTGCMQLHKPSYKAGAVWYPRLRVGFDAEFKWFGTAWIFFFSRPKSASVCYSYQTGKKLFRCTACVRSFFFFFFFISKDRFDGQNFDSRVIKRKRVERSTSEVRSTCRICVLYFCVLRFLKKYFEMRKYFEIRARCIHAVSTVKGCGKFCLINNKKG